MNCIQPLTVLSYGVIEFKGMMRTLDLPQADNSQSWFDSSASLLEAIVRSSEDAIITKNLNGIITSWNPGAERIFGYSEREIVGLSILKLIPEDLRSEEDMILRKIQRSRLISLT